MGRSLLVEVEGFVRPTSTLAVADALSSAVQEAVHLAVPEARAVLWYPKPAPV